MPGTLIRGRMGEAPPRIGSKKRETSPSSHRTYMYAGG